jgi:hypothetical protein
MKIKVFPLAVVFLILGWTAQGSGGHVSIERYAAIIKQQNNLWQRGPNGFSISVCWETAAGTADKALVQAGAKVWSDAEPNLQFTGWQDCVNGDNKSIRIIVEDVGPKQGPHTKALGRNLAGYPHGMSLDFTFANWSPYCAQAIPKMTAEEHREFCVQAVAAHEFGHALGFTHEQNRADSPCTTMDQGPDPDTFVTVYDPNSIMNYCNPKWNGDGKLSNFDVQAVQKLYG